MRCGRVTERRRRHRLNGASVFQRQLRAETKGMIERRRNRRVEEESEERAERTQTTSGRTDLEQTLA
jgi:hypothetical protein